MSVEYLKTNEHVLNLSNTLDLIMLGNIYLIHRENPVSK